MRPVTFAVMAGALLSASESVPAQPAGIGSPSIASPTLTCDLDGFDDHVRATMRQWGVAGASIAVVERGEASLLRGFGVRDVQSRAPVDEDTVFAVGSMTKSFTALLAGLMVDEGRLGFDDLLVRRLPHFALGDPYVTGAVTLRDVLSHRTGYDWRLDPILFSASSRAEAIGGLASAAPQFPFRSQYGYSNIMYVAAGEAIAATAGESWDALIARRVFAPLGMSRSNTSIRALANQANVATPHRNGGQEPRPIAWLNADVAGPAGSINSTARDMGRYIAMMAMGGRRGADTILQKSTYEQLLTPHANVGVEAQLRPFTNFHAYALGWEVMDYKGRKVAFHGGAINGMLSEMAFIPESGFGVVVLTNTDPVRHMGVALVRNVLDRCLGGGRSEWNETLLARGQGYRDFLLRAPPREVGTRPSRPLTAFTGDFRGSVGLVTVRLDNGRLRLRYGTFDTVIDHWHRDTFRGSFGPFADRLVTFSAGPAGTPDRVSIEVVGDFQRFQPAAGAR